MDIELAAGKAKLFSGPWLLDIKIQGKRAKPSAWEEVCQHQDDDVDYLELETRIGGNWRVQRQIALARRDRFLLLCDALIGTQRKTIDYGMVLPVCEGARFDQEEETVEATLTIAGATARMIPVGMCEWRPGTRRASMTFQPGKIALTQTTVGKGLFAPLFIELHPARVHHPVTWRQLTVGEDRKIQPGDVAVGYRLHAGDRQWLIYRSLAPPASRTVLGQNVTAEFFVGRFTPRGETRTLVEVEPESETQESS